MGFCFESFALITSRALIKLPPADPRRLGRSPRSDSNVALLHCQPIEAKRRIPLRQSRRVHSTWKISCTQTVKCIMTYCEKIRRERGKQPPESPLLAQTGKRSAAAFSLPNEDVSMAADLKNVETKRFG
mmetsp:Transcript_89804/g.164568  ORF Transcript_89804/g.164568 Transcript_89804/m.164568 type:complete len:129 (+) Transcript_89804:1431-1817(+)